MNVIGLEVSTSSAKAILFSSTGELLAESTRPLPNGISQVTWQEPQGIFQVALECLKDVASVDKGSIEAIGLGGIWHSLLLLDKERQPLEPIRTWADLSFTDSLFEVKEDQGLVDWVYGKTGCLGHGMYPLWKLYGMRLLEHPALSQTSYISSQIEYLFTTLTGEIGVSACTASGSGLMNIHTVQWDEELLEFVGLNSNMVAEIKEGYYTAPLQRDIATMVGLKQGIPVTVGCADGALNQISSGGLANGIMTFSVGTSGALRLASPTPLLGEEPATWCYYLVDGQRLAGVATHATSNLEWFMRQFSLDNDDHEHLAREASKLPVDSGPLFFPFIYGERAPGWQENRTGGFVGLTSEHTVVHLYNAVLEGILFTLYQSFLELQKVASLPVDIRLSGGIIHSPYWSQMAADIFGSKLTTTGNVHESTLGAALFALQASGALEHVREYTPPLMGTIMPHEERHRQYGKRFRRYLENYESTLGW